MATRARVNLLAVFIVFPVLFQGGRNDRPRLGFVTGSQ